MIRKKIIAFIGPDGSGKSYTIDRLKIELKNKTNIIYRYGSKKKDFNFLITKFSYQIYIFLKGKSKNKLNFFISNSYLYLIHYFFELFDNIIGIRLTTFFKKEFIIFDRYPIDRFLPMLSSYRKKVFKNSNIILKALKFFPYLFLLLYAYIYYLFLLRPDLIIYMDTSKSLLKSRLNYFYKEEEKLNFYHKHYVELFQLLKKNKYNIMKFSKISINDLFKEMVMK